MYSKKKMLRVIDRYNLLRFHIKQHAFGPTTHSLASEKDVYVFQFLNSIVASIAIGINAPLASTSNLFATLPLLY